MDSIIDCSEVAPDVEVSKVVPDVVDIVEVSEVVPDFESMDTEAVPDVESEGHIKTSNKVNQLNENEDCK